MNKRIIHHFFRMAAERATSKEDFRQYMLGCIGIRRDGAIVKAYNSPNCGRYRKVHAEYRALKKMDTGGILFVARVRHLDGEYGMSCPCDKCQKIIRSYRINKVYYTINESQYGLWRVKEDTHEVFSFLI